MMAVRTSLLLFLGFLSLAIAKSVKQHSWGRNFRPVQPLLKDISGMDYVEDNTFICVHDAKVDEGDDLVRVSLMRMPKSLKGVTWKPVDVSWPSDRIASDLESVAKVPGTNNFLLCESGDDGETVQNSRIYLATATTRRIKILDYIEWKKFYPTLENVEGTAIYDNFFYWVERSTAGSVFYYSEITFTPKKNLDSSKWELSNSGTFAISKIIETQYFISPDNPISNRLVVGLSIADNGEVLVVSSLDNDDDNGPFRSTITKVGSIRDTVFTQYSPTVLLGIMDGFKAEAVTLAGERVFFGTDDENYGGIIRELFTDTYQD